MQDSPNLNRIKAGFSSILKSLPSAIPYAGQAYATFCADVDTKKIREVLEDMQALNTEQTESILSSLNTTRETLETILKQMEKMISHSSQEKMNVVIPVGGRGISMFPITSVMPKCLVYIDDRSMLQQILNTFVPFQHIIKKVFVITREYTRAINENIRQGNYCDFVECREIDKNVPAALLSLKPELDDGPFLIHYADILIPSIDWGHVRERYDENSRRNKAIAMLLCSSYYPLGIGIIEESTPDVLKSFEEKPQNMLTRSFANIGVCVFDPRMLNHIEETDEGIFETSFRRFIEADRKVALYRVAKWTHVHELGDLYEIQQNYKKLESRTSRFSLASKLLTGQEQ
ncbi:MAG: hypothetical protein JW768_09450 [Chitinispirillaceae bacterium]|nr:hypothetical protein [Chitinispirillaceae bacterium]